MSKQDDAKKAQGYNPKPRRSICSECLHFTSRIETKTQYGYSYDVEKMVRCTKGNFAVKKCGTCDVFEFGK